MSKKIMFSDAFGLTKAVLEGRKVMTRRIVPERLLKDCVVTGEVLIKSPYNVGEVVAVAQSYETVLEKMIKSKGGYGEEENEFYKIHKDTPGWKNKMFVKADLMPHQIRITNIEVERLQEISESDAKNDSGCTEKNGYFFINGINTKFDTAKDAFQVLIDKISGRGTYKSNPFCFCYEFRLIK